MEWKKIEEELHKLTSLVGGWRELTQIPTIERDMALDKLKRLYDLLRFEVAQETVCEPDPDSQKPQESLASVALLSDGALVSDASVEEPTATLDAQEATETEVLVEAVPEEEVTTPEVVESEASVEEFDSSPVSQEEVPAEFYEEEPEPFDLDDVLFMPDEEPDFYAGYSTSEPEQEPQPSEEPMVEQTEAQAPNSATESEEVGAEPAVEESAIVEPVISPEVALPKREEMVAETDIPEITLDLESESDPAPVAESRSEESAALDVASESDPISTAEPDVPSASEPETPPASEPEAPKLQNSLFDLEEIPVHRRGSRRVLISLYGDPDIPVTQTTEHSKSASKAAPEHKENRSASERRAGRAERMEEPVFQEIPVVTEFRPHTKALADPSPVLGEVIQPEQRTVADTIVSPRRVESVVAADKTLHSMIALNDRFLLIGELFGGDQEAYNAAIVTLDRLESLEDCLIHIAENYTWNPNSDGAKLMAELLERKFAE